MKIKLCWKYLFRKYRGGDVNLVKGDSISNGFFFWCLGDYCNSRQRIIVECHSLVNWGQGSSEGRDGKGRWAPLGQSIYAHWDRKWLPWDHPCWASPGRSSYTLRETRTGNQIKDWKEICRIMSCILPTFCRRLRPFQTADNSWNYWGWSAYEIPQIPKILLFFYSTNSHWAPTVSGTVLLGTKNPVANNRDFRDWVSRIWDGGIMG